MPIRKNKKRFDPRYFMDEKMEEPTLKEGRELYAPQYDPREQERWEKEQKRKKKEKKDKDVPRGSEEIDYSLKEDLSHLADPAVWEALGLGAAKMASIWVPLLGIGGLAVIIKDAIDYLKKSPESSHDDALQYAIGNAKAEAESNNDSPRVDESLGAVESGLAQMQADKLERLRMEAKELAIEFRSATTEQRKDIREKILMLREKMESIKAASQNLKQLMSEKTIDVLNVIKDKADNLGDIENFNQEEFLKVADNKTKNAIKILSFLGSQENRKKWDPEWDV